MGAERTASVPLGALVLGISLLLFLARPLLHLRDHHYTSAGFLTTVSSLLEVDPEHVPANPVLSDEGTEMLPWLIHDSAELREGRLPLWNSQNGGGVPQLANYQSAVLSPFSLPYYVLPLRLALVVGRGLELFALGFFTLLFLREIGVGTVGAILGAVAFTYCGHSVLLLGYPHGEVAAGLPAGCLLVERVLRRRAQRRPTGWGLAGLALCVGGTLVSGHPETAYFVLVLVALYACARLLGGARGRAGSVRSAAGIGARLAAAMLLGAGLAAPQVLPFLEYLRESAVIVERVGRSTALPAEALHFALFPNAQGDPSAGTAIGPSYENENTTYAGGTVLLLLLVSIGLVRRERRLAPLLLLVVVWALYAFEPFGIGAPFDWIPTLTLAPRFRSQPVFLFAAAVCAAIAVDTLIRRAPRRRFRPAALTLGVGVALLVAGLIGARSLASVIDLDANPDVREGIRAHLIWVAALQVAATIAAAGLWVVRGARGRIALGAVLIACAFLQTGWLLRDYNPTVPDRFVYPRSEAVQEIAEVAAGRQVLTVGADAIPPHVNLVYGFAMPATYDALWVRRYDGLYRDMFGGAGNWRIAVTASRRGLDLLGIDLVLSPWPWVCGQPLLERVLLESSANIEGLELSSGNVVTWTFLATRDGLGAIALYIARAPEARACAVQVRVLGDAGEELGAHLFRAGIAGGGQADGRRRPAAIGVPLESPGEWLVLPIGPVPHSEGREVSVQVNCPTGCPEGTVSLAVHPLPADVGADRLRIDVDGRTEAGLPIAGPCYGLGSWELRSEARSLGLYELRDAPPRHRLADGVIVAEGDLEVRYLLRHAELDVVRTVVLSADDPAVEGLQDAGIAHRRLRGRVAVDVGTSAIAFVDTGAGQVHYLVPAQGVSATPSPSTPLPEEVIVDLEGMEAVGDLSAFLMGPPPPEGGAPGRVRLLEEAPTSVRLDVATDRPRVLVTRRPAYPGWVALVDGREAPTLRVDHAFLGVAVGAGEHEVELRYVPRSFHLGLAVALVCAALLVWFCRRAR